MVNSEFPANSHFSFFSYSFPKQLKAEQTCSWWLTLSGMQFPFQCFECPTFDKSITLLHIFTQAHLALGDQIPEQMPQSQCNLMTWWDLFWNLSSPQSMFFLLLVSSFITHCWAERLPMVTCIRLYRSMKCHLFIHFSNNDLTRVNCILGMQG